MRHFASPFACPVPSKRSQMPSWYWFGPSYPLILVLAKTCRLLFSSKRNFHCCLFPVFMHRLRKSLRSCESSRSGSFNSRSSNTHSPTKVCCNKYLRLGSATPGEMRIIWNGKNNGSSNNNYINDSEQNNDSSNNNNDELRLIMVIGLSGVRFGLLLYEWLQNWSPICESQVWLQIDIGRHERLDHGSLSRMWLGDLNSAQIVDWLSQQSDYYCPIACKFPINS